MTVSTTSLRGLGGRLSRWVFGETYWELVVNFGKYSRDDWYVRVWSAKDKSLVPFMHKDAKIHVVRKIAKWSVGAGYGVTIDADEVKTDLSDSNKTSKKL